MKKIILMVFMVTMILVGTTSCGNKSEVSNNFSGKENTEESVSIKKINSDEAKALIEDGAILVDVRTKEEYDEKHIDGSILIPLDELESLIVEEVEDKDTSLIVYCRSGRRSNIAAKQLIDMGYKNIYDLGSISSWKE